VIGIKISLSAQHPDYDYPEICEVCAGTYPKTFKFTGWHPQCLCHVTPVLADEKDLRAWLRGETKTIKKDPIRELPKNFVKFTKDNMGRFLGYKTIPYWMQDNADIILSKIGGDKAAWPKEGIFIEDMIARANTTEEIRDVLWGTGYHVSDSFIGLNPEAMKEAVSEIIQLKNQYDETLWRVTTFFDLKGGGVYAKANETEMKFSVTIFDGSKEYIEGLLMRDVECGFHPEGCFTIKSVVDHEFAHVLTLGDIRRVAALKGEELQQVLGGSSREAALFNSVNRTYTQYLNR